MVSRFLFAMRLLLIPLFASIILLSSASLAAIDAFQFETPAQEQQYRSLIEELRCPKCQNQNIADSNAPLAADLRQKVYEMIQDDRNSVDIKAYMVQRYGDFVTYLPPVKPLTWPLWFGPIGGIIIIGFILAVWIHRRNQQDEPSDLNEQERKRLATVLNGQQAAIQNSQKSMNREHP